jgi:hypothetical protein
MLITQQMSYIGFPRGSAMMWCDVLNDATNGHACPRTISHRRYSPANGLCLSRWVASAQNAALESVAEHAP